MVTLKYSVFYERRNSQGTVKLFFFPLCLVTVDKFNLTEWKDAETIRVYDSGKRKNWWYS